MKKVLFLSIIMALALTMIMPLAVMAASPPAPAAPPTTFTAQGVMASIDTGTVSQLGKSDYWLVKDRHIWGNFVTGDLGSSSFTVTYGGIFALSTQEGALVGKMVAGSKEVAIIGKVDALTMVYYAPWNMNLPKLRITGTWAGVKGLNANGTFEAWMVFVPDNAGHVLQIVDSSFSMTGKYTKNR